MIVRLPGVYPPQHDTNVLTDVLVAHGVTARTRVLDLCTGTGVLSVVAAKAGAGHVVAVDIARRACLNTRLNAMVAGKGIDVRRGDLTAAVQGELFDLVVSNPPYVPAWADELPTGSIERAWDAGKDGRALLDRIAVSACEVLAPGGVLLLLQSALCGVQKTETMLEECGLEVTVAARSFVPFGPVMRARRQILEERGLIVVGQDTEELVVLRATKTAPPIDTAA
ncbi:HemK2/MTQ2 family protein methyltransferase [Rhodococcus qingshengii]|uniref:HemK2/MTQ2 family protein methyltransferase n=1 Tax=Rhodococcus qingshengii TaxID=334542 RepID=UPI001BECA292|nr:HemK2/MTQ2 family protein methyltransferase [Rhodococcus qingshengii]MBT2273559.1 methyltransferase [Rhodococcus qingshengii]